MLIKATTNCLLTLFNFYKKIRAYVYVETKISQWGVKIVFAALYTKLYFNTNKKLNDFNSIIYHILRKTENIYHLLLIKWSYKRSKSSTDVYYIYKIINHLIYLFVYLFILLILANINMNKNENNKQKIKQQQFNCKQIISSCIQMCQSEHGIVQ